MRCPFAYIWIVSVGFSNKRRKRVHSAKTSVLLVINDLRTSDSMSTVYGSKKDGRREPFTRTKILNGILRACEKRPISLKTIDSLVDEIERDIRSGLEREVSSEAIGELVMDKLRALDEVAYVRFASVYRQFTDIDRFMEELEQMRKGEN